MTDRRLPAWLGSDPLTSYRRKYPMTGDSR